MQDERGKAFIDRIVSLPADAVAPDLDAVLAPSLTFEAELRKVFVNAQDDPLLTNPHVGLVDIFDAPKDIRTTRARVVQDDRDMVAKHVMSLKKTMRRKTGKPSMVESVEEFQKNWAVFSEGSLSQFLDWDNVVAAGGSVLACLQPLPDSAKESKRNHRKYYHTEGFPTSDVDLFLWGLTAEEAEVKINKIYEAVRDSVPWDVTVLRTRHTVSIHSQYPYRSVQIVLRLYRSPAEILAGFDVDSCSFAYDGRRVYGNPRAIVSMMRQSNTVDMTRRSPSYEVRLSKYADRGYEVYIPSLRRDDIDPTIYERSIATITGLARLLVLENIKDTNTRDAFVNKRRALRTRPNASRPWKKGKRRYKGDLKEDNSIVGAEMNDYDVASLHVPYGPGWDARRIEKLVYQTDLGMNSTFNPKNKDRRLHRHPAFFGTAAEVLEDCCEHCPEPIDEDERELKRSEDASYITGRISFITENPGRQSLSGSFNPIDVGEWSEQVYIGNTEKLFSAIVAGDIARVRQLLESVISSSPTDDVVDVNRRDHVGRTALHLAILVGASDVAELLIDKGARLIARLADGRNALHLAAQRGDVEVVKKLLERSKENEVLGNKKKDNAPEDKDEKGSVKDSSDDDWSSDPADGMDVVTKKEVEEGADGDDEDDESATNKVKPVPSTSKPAEVEPEVEEELPDILDLDLAEWDHGLTALGYGALSGSTAVIDVLVHAGASVQPAVEFHRLPLTLTLAVLDEDVAVTAALKLIDHGARISAANTDGLTVFHKAVAMGKVKVVSAFLKREPNLSAVLDYPTFNRQYPNSFVSPLVSAVGAGRYALPLLLLAYGALTEPSEKLMGEAMLALPSNQYFYKSIQTEAAWRPLETAIAGFDHVAYALLDAGADVNVKCHNSISQYPDSRNFRSLLDGVRFDIQKVKEKIEDTKNQASSSSISDEKDEPPRVSDAAPTWVAHLNKLVHLTYGRRDTTEKSDWQIKYEKQQAEQREITIKSQTTTLRFLEGIEAKLVSAGAKTWDEMFPLNPSTAVKSNHRQDLRRARDIPSPSVYDLLSDSHTKTPVPPHLTSKYDELFEAAFTGNTEKIKELCLPEGKKVSALQITVQAKLPTKKYANTGYTPFFAALAQKKYATARFILAVAAAQYHPDDGTKKKFNTRDISLDDDDDDDDNESVDSDETVNQETVTFVDIANSKSQVQCKVHPKELLQTSTAGLFGSDGSLQHGIPLMLAIQANNLEMFAQVANMYKLLPTQPSTIHDKSLLTRILSFDNVELLHEYLKRTAFVVPQKLEDGDEIAEEGVGAKAINDQNRIYLGLNVHGRKRADLARKNDPDATNNDFEKRYEPLVWLAASHSSFECLSYLAGDRPLEALRAYAQSTNSEEATIIRGAKNVEKVLPTWLGWTTTSVGENPLVALLMSSGKQEQCQKLMAVGSQFKGVVSPQFRIKFIGMNAILLATDRRLDTDVLKLFMNSGVDHNAVDHFRGYNVFHILATQTGQVDEDKEDPTLTLLHFFLDTLPKEDVNAMLEQKSKERMNTPLLVAIKLGNAKVANILIERSPPSVLLLSDVNGHTPLHVAVNTPHLDFVKSLLGVLPSDQIHVENAVGQTPLDAVVTSWLSQVSTQLSVRPYTLPVLAESGYRWTPQLQAEKEQSRKDTYVEEQQLATELLKTTLSELEHEGKVAPGDKIQEAFTSLASFIPTYLSQIELLPDPTSRSDHELKQEAAAQARLEILKLLLAVPQNSRQRVHLLDVQASVKHDLWQSKVRGGEAVNQQGYYYRRRKEKITDKGSLAPGDTEKQAEKNASWTWSSLKIQRERL